MTDTYLTIAAPSEGIYREKGSRFLAFAYPAESWEQARQHIETLKTKYFDARHHCWAYRFTIDGTQFRVNDDGEPSATAGRPILGQLLAREITNTIVIVVRYFGGTKLGTSGLIQAYKTAAAEALNAAQIIEKTQNEILNIEFDYLKTNEIMKLIKFYEPRILEQHFDNVCRIKLSIRCGHIAEFITQAETIDNLKIIKQDETIR